MKSILLILCLFTTGTSFSCSEDDLDESKYAGCYPIAYGWRCK